MFGIMVGQEGPVAQHQHTTLERLHEPGKTSTVLYNNHSLMEIFIIGLGCRSCESVRDL